ncbi:PAS domain S-box protein [Blastococcus sp. CT_GayMR19]|uniref:SpoIIE family protein phosphatase n=1 Tax=Blastococcus sp. CT_GayMR19 TaxID=2559608 RepID=UPI00107388E3|nr:SpoIIE family protein phosphatase [Blastococcus sp. CT_GayMR19]TFV78412.1 PAS domain S-box protein [Blastococcus sp. CT_GayMR19]
MPTSGVAATALLEALPDVVVVADAHGCIVYTNPAVRSLLGRDPAALRGEPLTVLVPERFRSAHVQGFHRFLATGVGRLVGATTQVPALHADGSEVAVELTLSRLDGVADGTVPAPEQAASGGVVVAVLRDASTLIRLERQLEVGRYLAATLRVTAALTEARDAEVAFRQLLPTLCAELDWDAATLWQPDGFGGPLVRTGAWTPPGAPVPALHDDVRRRSFARGEGLPGLAWQRGAPVVMEDLWADPDFLRTDAARADALRTGIAFPVLRGDDLLAVCELFSREPRPVPQELVDVLASAGRQIGQFLARLRAESEVRELADTLQRSLLPSHLPAIPGVQLAARYRAGAEGVFVGGDTYDVAPLPDGRWMVLIADVCGTGAEAAGMTALTRHTARAASASGNPADVLSAVNTALLHEQGAGPLRFVTACCLVLELGSGSATARVALAGHPRPMLRDVDGTVAEIGAVGLPLGIDVDVAYAEVSVPLCRGSMLVLYTDGVTEARDDDGVQFGEAGLITVLRETAGRPAAVTVEAVSAAVERQLRGSRYGADDQAVLALGC